MLGAYPIAVTPLATLKSAANIVEADMSTTLALAVAAVGASVIGTDSSTALAASVAWDSQLVSSADSSTSISATAQFDSTAFAQAESATAITLSSSFDSLAIAQAESSTTTSLSSSFEAQAFAQSDFAASPSVSPLFNLSALIGADASTGAALSSSFDGVGRLMSSADMSTTLALSTSWDSAFSTVIGSTWSVSIDPSSGIIATAPTVAAQGTGYTIDQTLRLTGGNNDATVKVIGISAGRVTAVSLQTAGTGYAAGVTYATTRVTGATGTGCTLLVTSIVEDYHLFISGATKGSTATSPQTLTSTFRSLSFATADMATSLALTCDGVSGATAGSAMSTTDSTTVDWQGLAIGPVPVDWSVVLQLVTSWGGQQLRVTSRLLGQTGPFDLLGQTDTIQLSGE